MGKTGSNRRGTIRNYVKRGQHISYKRFEGFHLPLQLPGQPSGVCLGSTKGSEANCRCGKHNLAWKAKEAKRVAALRAEEEAAAEVELVLVEDMEPEEIRELVHALA